MMRPLGVIHTALGALSLILGCWILFQPKGTHRHAWVGRAYVGAMLGLNLTALSIYRLTGAFNVFHMLALVSLATLAVGFIAVRRRRSMHRWLWRHYQYMCWSYVGLLAATLNEAWARAPALRHAAGESPALPLASSLALVVLAAFLIRRNQARLLGRFDVPLKGKGRSAGCFALRGGAASDWPHGGAETDT